MMFLAISNQGLVLCESEDIDHLIEVMKGRGFKETQEYPWVLSDGTIRLHFHETTLADPDPVVEEPPPIIDLQRCRNAMMGIIENNIKPDTLIGAALAVAELAREERLALSGGK